MAVAEPNEIVQHFNEYFAIIAAKLAEKIPAANIPYSSYLPDAFSDSFALYPTNMEKIIIITDDLKNKTSYGYDEIPVTIARQCIKPIAGVLSALINCSFTNGFFPDDLKIAKVCPVFKGGCKKEFSNYRPISILPTFSKIYEKAMHRRLESYINCKKILIKNQYGFCTNHSTYMAMPDLYDKITK